MKIHTPSKPPEIQLKDINGNAVEFGKGRKVLLSLFREATCPFCNYRVYELTNNYPGLSKLGLDIVVVFKSDCEDILKFIANRPRPFRMVADPDGNAHKAFFVSSSIMGKLKAMLVRMADLMHGMGLVGMRGMLTGNLMPADFLIDENGIVIETYYGRDAGDHIKMERIEQFAGPGRSSRQAA